jgi:4-amino-4-deoxy-L-arabinose transferase-like glycosyltransferase
MRRTAIVGSAGLAAGLVILAASLFTVTVSQGIPHSEDEAAYLFQAQVFAKNRLTVPTPPLEAAFFSPFVVDYNGLRFGKYPPGWPLLLSLGVRAGQPWLVNALLGAVTLLLVARIAHLFYCQAKDNATNNCYLPWLATGLLLVTPAFLFQTGLLLSHPAALFWITLALLGLNYVRRGHRLAAVAVGICLGMAFLTRPLAATGSGIVIVLFAVITAGPRLAAIIVAGTAPVALLLPFYWWWVIGSPALSAYTMVWPYDRPGFGPDIGPYGYTFYDAIFINLRLKLQMVANGLFGWPGWSNLFFIAVMVILMVRQLGQLNVRRQQPDMNDTPPARFQLLEWDWLMLGLGVTPIVLHIFYWAFGGADGDSVREYYDNGSL